MAAHRDILRILLLLGLCVSASLGQLIPVADFSMGADLSFLKQQEDAGTKFRDSTLVKPGLEIFKNHGYSWVRLRLFHSPTDLPNNLEYTVAMAKQAKGLGFKFLLDFHYSDTWADPGQQLTPASWKGLSHNVLVDSVYRYTRAVMLRFRQEGAYPDMVQVGNEINSGMMLPDGASGNFKNLADLLKAGIRGIDSSTIAVTGGLGTSRAMSKPKIMIHIAAGGDKSFTQWFFNSIIANGVAFDVIGQSYYPLWHGTLDDLRANLTFMGQTYAKDIFVVETAMTAFPNGTSPFPLNDSGQVLYLQELEKIIRATPNQLGRGLMWWEPTGNAYLGTSRGLFDRQGNARLSMKVFDGQGIVSGLGSFFTARSKGLSILFRARLGYLADGRHLPLPFLTRSSNRTILRF
jgi:arabinogalactan endo-1,4-beta-galactosidase